MPCSTAWRAKASGSTPTARTRATAALPGSTIPTATRSSCGSRSPRRRGARLNLGEEREHALQEQLGGRAVVRRKRRVGEEVLLPRVEEELAVGRRLDEVPRGRQVLL